MPQPLSIIIVDKLGELKTLNVKDYKEDELYKKNSSTIIVTIITTATINVSFITTTDMTMKFQTN